MAAHRLLAVWRDPDEHGVGALEPLPGGGEEALGLRLERVLQRAAVDLHRVGNPSRQATREDDRPHEQVVGERHLRVHPLEQLTHR